ncbi:hypothetical protein [Streptomyces sp. NPDC005141]
MVWWSGHESGSDFLPEDSKGGGGGNVGEDPVRFGLIAAAERLSRHGIEMPWREISRSVDEAILALRREEDVPLRAVELFIELVAVSATSRIVYGERPLKSKETERFLHIFSDFINSYWHPPPQADGPE